MRFLKVLTFAIFMLCSLNAVAQPMGIYLQQESQRQATLRDATSYSISDTNKETLKNAGYTDAQIDQFNKKLNQFVNEGTKLSQVTSDSEKEMYRLLSREDKNFQEKISQARDVVIRNERDSKNIAALGETVAETLMDTLVIGGTIAAGILTGGLGAGAVFVGGVLLEKWLFGDNNIIFLKIMRAFSSIDNGCWFCSIFEKLFNAVNTFAATISNTMAGYFIKLLGIFLLFYIVFKVLKAVISFGEIDPKQFFTELFMPLLKTAIAIIVLYSMPSFYKHVVTPLAELSIGFSISMQETGKQNIDGVAKIRHVTREGGYTTEETACKIVSPSATSESVGLGPEVGGAIQCFLRTISVQLIEDMAVGATFVAASWKVGESIFPEWSMLGIGIIMFLGCFFIFLSFPFKLLDSLFRLMFVCGLMPLWVILWVLPATRSYSQKAFNMFLNVLITFICLSVIMMMVSIILYNALPDDFAEVVKLLANGDDKKALAKIDWSTGNFFMFVAMMFLALELLKKADSFVGQFAEGGSLGIGSGLESFGRKGVQLVGSKVAKPLAKKAAKGTGKAIGAGLEKSWEGAKSLAKKTPYAAGYALGAVKRGLRNLNSGPKMSPSLAMMPTGMLPPNPTGDSGGGTPPLKQTKRTQRESLPDNTIKETKGITFTDETGKKKMEHSYDTVTKDGREISTSVKREKFDDAGNSTGSVSVEKDKVSGKKTLTEKDAKGNEVRIIVKEADGTTTTQNNYVYDVDGKLSSFEKKIEEKIDGKLTVTKYVKVDAKTGTETDILPHP